MNQRLSHALEQCLVSMEKGMSLEDCIKHYQGIDQELISLLKTAELIKSLGPNAVPMEAEYKSQRALLAQLYQFRTADNRKNKNTFLGTIDQFPRAVGKSLHRLSPAAFRLAVAAAICGIFILLSGGLIATSAKSLPGDSLYPIKIAVEDLRVNLTPDKIIRQEMEDKYEEQRVDEVEQLLGLERTQVIRFTGTISEMNGSQLNVSGILVRVKSSTVILGASGENNQIQPGMTIAVDGSTDSQGWVSATEIRILEYQIYGTIQSIDSGRWQISNTTVLIDSSTLIDKELQIGDEVTIRVRPENNQLVAVSIISGSRSIATPTSSVEPDEEMTTPENDFSDPSSNLEFTGMVEQVNSTQWIINGENIIITGKTQIEDGIVTRDSVIVTYQLGSDGSKIAIDIHKQDSSEPPTEQSGEGATSIPTEETEQTVSTAEQPSVEKTEEPSATQEPVHTPEPLENGVETH